jgi:hypothetical protein
VVRFLLWRVLGAFVVAGAIVVGASAVTWLAHGGAGAALRGSHRAHAPGDGALALPAAIGSRLRAALDWRGVGGVASGPGLLVALVVASGGVGCSRLCARRRRDYVRLRVTPYRGDRAAAEAVVRMFDWVQFLDSPERGEGEDLDGELVAAGAGEGDIAF